MLPINVEVAVDAGYATNDLDATVGARAGVEFHHFYAGLVGAYYFGQNLSYPADTTLTPQQIKALGSYRQLALGGEVGYGFDIGPVTIRPLFGVGDAVTYGVGGCNPPGCPTGFYATFDQPYIQPGGLVELRIDPFIFGVYAGAFSPLSEGSETGFVMNGQVGLRF